MFMAEHKHHAEARRIDLIGLRQTHGQLIAEARAAAEALGMPALLEEIAAFERPAGATTGQ